MEAIFLLRRVTALLFQHIVIILVLTLVCKGHSQEISPSQTLRAVTGDDVVLPCQLEPPVDAVQMTIEWGKPDLNPRFVFVRHNGQELQTDQNTAYKGRVSLSIDKLKHGDVSLNLSKVKVSDSGRYRCYIQQQNKEYFVELLVVKNCESSNTSHPCITMSVVFGAAGLILGGLIGGGVMWKYRRNPRIHRLLDIEKGDNDDNAAAAAAAAGVAAAAAAAVAAAAADDDDDVLKKLKKELENQKKKLEDELDGVKVQLQENKEQLQFMEMKLTQKDTAEKPEALLMEKQNILHDQWTLDEKKKNCEREILKREELLELTEGQPC